MKIDLFYCWTQQSWKKEGEIEVMTYDGSKYNEDHTLIKVITGFEVPDAEAPTKGEIVASVTAKLQQQKKALLVETQEKIDVIEDKIRQLACIEYQEEVAQ